MAAAPGAHMPRKPTGDDGMAPIGSGCPMEIPCRGGAGGSASAELAAELEGMLKTVNLEADSRFVQIGRGGFEDDLKHYSLLESVGVEAKARFVERAQHDNHFNRVMGSICGMGVGDALGHPFEFMPAQDEVTRGSPHFNLATMEFVEEANTFRLKRGQWTDDAAMGLCMADSLLLREGFDGSDMRVRFWCWWNRGYNNAFRKDPSRSNSVGLGGNIAKSLQAISHARGVGEVPPAFEAASEDAGNGSLMRFTPVALFLHATDMRTVHDLARRSSYTTHPGIIAAEACSLLAHLIVRALQLPAGAPASVKQFLEQTTEEYYHMSGLAGKSGWGFDQMQQLTLGRPEQPSERCWAWKEELLDVKGTLRARGSRYNGYPVSSGYFGSYSLDGLGMALWSVYHTTSFDEAVTRSVNLLGDADSHGSITGQLAGAIYGYRAINPQFLRWLNQWDDHDFAIKGALLSHVGSKFASGGAAKLMEAL